MVQILAKETTDKKKRKQESAGRLMSKKIKYIIVICIILLFTSINVIIPRVGKNQIKQYIYDLSKGDEFRGKAIDSLEQIGMPAMPYLLDALKNAETQTKIDIIQLLAKSNSKETAMQLIPLLQDKDWKIRFFTAEALGDIGNRDTVRPLLEIWRTEGSFQVSQQIALALNKIGYKEEVENIAQIFNDTHDSYIKALSAILLYEVTKESTYREFIISIIESEDSAIKNKVIFALKFIKSPKTIALLNTSSDNFDQKTKDLIIKIQSN